MPRVAARLRWGRPSELLLAKQRPRLRDQLSEETAEAEREHTTEEEQRLATREALRRAGHLGHSGVLHVVEDAFDLVGGNDHGGRGEAVHRPFALLSQHICQSGELLRRLLPTPSEKGDDQILCVVPDVGATSRG